MFFKSFNKEKLITHHITKKENKSNHTRHKVFQKYFYSAHYKQVKN